MRDLAHHWALKSKFTRGLVGGGVGLEGAEGGEHALTVATAGYNAVQTQVAAN